MHHLGSTVFTKKYHLALSDTNLISLLKSGLCLPVMMSTGAREKGEKEPSPSFALVQKLSSAFSLYTSEKEATTRLKLKAKVASPR